ncbi:hypothetical protein Trydic_g9767 [Trypoxylus dichotomus]
MKFSEVMTVQKFVENPTQLSIKENVVSTVKYGGDIVMMAGNVVSILRFIDEIIDKHMCINILMDSYFPSVLKLGPKDKAIFLHDNDPKHFSALVREWLFYNVRQK